MPDPTLILAAFFNDLDPVAIGPIAGGISIRWYGLSYIAGFAAAWLIMSKLAKRGLIGIPLQHVGDAIMTVVLGTLLGGRIGYALFYKPSLFVDFDGSFPFWGLLKIHEGGMASHGGMIGLAVASLWIARRYAVPALHVVDVLCLTGPVGVVFVRTANFINGELLGRVVAQPGEPAPLWSVRYPTELLERPGDVADPLAREAALWDVIDANGLLLPNEPPYAGVARLISRVRSGDAELAAQVEPLLTARHPTQLYQAFAEGLVLLVVLWIVWAKPRRPGIVGAWFFVLYGVGRVITEIWRLPDAHLESPLIAGLSRGQWLSVGLVIVGLTLFVRIARAKRDPVGGWLVRAPAWAGDTHKKTGDDNASPAR